MLNDYNFDKYTIIGNIKICEYLSHQCHLRAKLLLKQFLTLKIQLSVIPNYFVSLRSSSKKKRHDNC
jgi:hypothetical protein